MGAWAEHCGKVLKLASKDVWGHLEIGLRAQEGGDAPRQSLITHQLLASQKSADVPRQSLVARQPCSSN